MFKIVQKTTLIFCLIAAVSSCKKPQDLSFTGFRQFRVEPLSFSSSKISCEVGVHNPNSFSVKVKHVEAAVSVAGNFIGDYLLDSTIILPANQPYFIPVQMEVKNGTLLSNVLSVLAGDSIPYTLTGKVKGGRKVAMVELPFSYSGHLSQKDFNLFP